MFDTLEAMKILAKELTDARAHRIQDARALLYYARTGHLAPGKSHLANCDANRQRFQHWHDSGLMEIDILSDAELARSTLDELRDTLSAQADLLDAATKRAEKAEAARDDWERRYGLLQVVLGGSGA